MRILKGVSKKKGTIPYLETRGNLEKYASHKEINCMGCARSKHNRIVRAVQENDREGGIFSLHLGF